MLEIEMKFRVEEFALVEKTLRAWQATPQPAIDEADHYYNGCDRDFARTDEALRLRRIGPKNLATYKGPKQAGPAKTRTEIEVPLAEGPEVADKFCRFLEHLGYCAVAVVRKKRVIYKLERNGFSLEACLDDVERVGRFVEVEIMAPEGDRARAETTLGEVARELGLTASERRSYLEMFLESKPS